MTNLRTCLHPGWVSRGRLRLLLQERTYIIILSQPKKLPDSGGTLWTQSLWVSDIGQSSHIARTLLDHHERKDGKITGNDASTNGFTLPLSSPAGAVAGVALGEEQSDTGWVHHSLLHRETLLVVTAGDFEDVACKFGSNAVTRNLLPHALVHEDAEAALIFNFDEFLRPIGGITSRRVSLGESRSHPII